MAHCSVTPDHDLLAIRPAMPREFMLPCVLVLLISLAAGVTAHVAPRFASVTPTESTAPACLVATAQPVRTASSGRRQACDGFMGTHSFR